MDEIAKALTLVAAVSVAVERVTEILKQMVPALAKERTDAEAENRRRAALQILSGAIGSVVAWEGQLQLAGHSGWTVYLLIGAMSSGGAAFWNHALDAVRASKISKQADADEKVAVATVAKASAAMAAARVAAPAAPAPVLQQP